MTERVSAARPGARRKSNVTRSIIVGNLDPPCRACQVSDLTLTSGGEQILDERRNAGSAFGGDEANATMSVKPGSGVFFGGVGWAVQLAVGHPLPLVGGEVQPAGEDDFLGSERFALGHGQLWPVNTPLTSLTLACESGGRETQPKD